MNNIVLPKNSIRSTRDVLQQIAYEESLDRSSIIMSLPFRLGLRAFFPFGSLPKNGWTSSDRVIVFVGDGTNLKDPAILRT